MLTLWESLALGFVALIALMFFWIVAHNWPAIFSESTDPRSVGRYRILDHDNVWFECSREEWLADKTSDPAAKVLRSDWQF